MKYERGDYLVDDIYYEQTIILDVCGLAPYEYYELDTGRRMRADLMEQFHTFVSSIFREAFDGV